MSGDACPLYHTSTANECKVNLATLSRQTADRRTSFRATCTDFSWWPSWSESWERKRT